MVDHYGGTEHCAARFDEGLLAVLSGLPSLSNDQEDREVSH